VPVLNRHNLLTPSENYDLLNKLSSPQDRANKLLYAILPSKGTGAYKLFVDCLQEEKKHMGHQKLVEIFSTYL